MKFTLHYQGPLKSNGSPQDKHAIREALHTQLRDLWEHRPLARRKEKLLDPNRRPDSLSGGNNLIFSVGEHRFASIISSRLHTTATLDITLLRPEQPGTVFAQSGDIDNRLKTLLDALTIPPHLNALPKNFSPTRTQTPFFCLLENDALVTGVSIHTHRWLNPDAASRADVILIIQVTTATDEKTLENLDFA